MELDTTAASCYSLVYLGHLFQHKVSLNAHVLILLRFTLAQEEGVSEPCHLCVMQK